MRLSGGKGVMFVCSISNTVVIARHEAILMRSLFSCPLLRLASAHRRRRALSFGLAQKKQKPKACILS